MKIRFIKENDLFDWKVGDVYEYSEASEFYEQKHGMDSSPQLTDFCCNDPHTLIKLGYAEEVKEIDWKEWVESKKRQLRKKQSENKKLKIIYYLKCILCGGIQGYVYTDNTPKNATMNDGISLEDYYAMRADEIKSQNFYEYQFCSECNCETLQWRAAYNIEVNGKEVNICNVAK